MSGPSLSIPAAAEAGGREAEAARRADLEVEVARTADLDVVVRAAADVAVAGVDLRGRAHFQRPRLQHQLAAGPAGIVITDAQRPVTGVGLTIQCREGARGSP